MIKELIFAIFLGALLGFGATGSILTLRQRSAQSNPAPNPTIAPVATESTPGIPDPTPTNQLDNQPTTKLTISSPGKDSVVATSKVTISGTATPDNLIIARSPIQTIQGLVTSDGSFEIEIELESGFNTIIITSINPSDNSQESTEINLTFSTAKI